MLEKVKKILSKYVDTPPRESITLESSFLEELQLSSIELVTMMVDFEDEFQIEIPEKIISSIVTVGDIIKILDEEYKIR